MYTIYIDESGNTGDIININSFKDQPIFTLAAVVVNSNNKDSLYNNIKEILNKHKVNSVEIKSTKILKNIDQNKTLINDLISCIKKYNVRLYIEVADKKFQLTRQLCSDFIIPPYFYYSPLKLDDVDHKKRQHEHSIFLNKIASLLSPIMSDVVFKKYEEYCIKENKKIDDYINISNTLKHFIKVYCFVYQDDPKKENICADIDSLIKYIDDLIGDLYELVAQCGEQQALNLLSPLPDIQVKNNKIITYHLNPHITAISHVIGRIAKTYSSDLKNFTVIHDEQIKSDNSIEQFLDKFPKRSANYLKSEYADYCFDNNIIFKPSESELGIQLADFFAGFFFRLIRNSLYNFNVTDIEKKLVKDLLVYEKISPFYVLSRYQMKKLTDEQVILFNSSDYEMD